ncbi:ABC transporter permease [Sphingobacterium sp. SRCM116780]|uniref:ABC transporter permease n=1 Tax=Sphingobacterium sp. SRCM116780 TaxID=2907623 RepID=UPI001F24670F|nr:ABC transporter permease [Sphingobacterium sp. SRCM116780]UIR55850.1 ABC transporter permease [Sphingobacterium sp. SRCM116780]
MEINFEFQKERKVGDFLQSFIDLLKIILGHFVRTVFSISIIPLSITTILYYFLSTKITFSSESNSFEDFNVYLWGGVLSVAVLLLVLYMYGICIEYFILLKNQKNTDFTGRDLLTVFRSHIGMYVKFFFASLLVMIIIGIPLGIAMFIIMFIPLFGSFGIGILFSIIGLWFFCSFLFYREGYFSLSTTFSETFNVIRKNVIQYGIATYIVSFIFQVVIMMLTFIPALIIGLISYNFLEFDSSFFDGSLGKMLMTLGALLVTILTIFLYMGSVLANGIIYETAKDFKYGDRIYAMIAKLGGGQ